MPDPPSSPPGQQASQIEQTLRAPRSAAFAGIGFALLYGAALVLLTLPVPAYPASGSPVPAG